jgi:phosphate transport system substrate-binding protein
MADERGEQAMKTSICTMVLVASGALALAGVGCARKSEGSITLAGSTAFQPFAEKLAEQYLAVHKDVRINVQGGGSAVGVQSALAGSADIGMADLLTLPDEAKALTAIVVARDGIAIIVHPTNPLANLTAAQARAVFAGQVTNWKELNGADATIRIISREEGSGTRKSFQKLVLGEAKLSSDALFQNSNGTIREAVANNPDAIGYLSIGLVDSRVKPVSYNEVAATNENVKRGTYPLARPVFFLTKGEPRPMVRAFIDYVLSDAAQQVLEKEGLISVK